MGRDRDRQTDSHLGCLYETKGCKIQRDDSKDGAGDGLSLTFEVCENPRFSHLRQPTSWFTNLDFLCSIIFIWKYELCLLFSMFKTVLVVMLQHASKFCLFFFRLPFVGKCLLLKAMCDCDFLLQQSKKSQKTLEKDIFIDMKWQKFYSYFSERNVKLSSPPDIQFSCRFLTHSLHSPSIFINQAAREQLGTSAVMNHISLSSHFVLPNCQLSKFHF